MKRKPRYLWELNDFLNTSPDGAYDLLHAAAIGDVFTSIATLEQAVVNWSVMRVGKSKDDGFSFSFDELRGKSMTLGRLVEKLGELGFKERDKSYLGHVLKLRNWFVHDFVWEAPLPGELAGHDVAYANLMDATTRWARHFRFATHKIPLVMERAGILRRTSFDEGFLLSPVNPPD